MSRDLQHTTIRVLLFKSNLIILKFVYDISLSSQNLFSVVMVKDSTAWVLIAAAALAFYSTVDRREKNQQNIRLRKGHILRIS